MVIEPTKALQSVAEEIYGHLKQLAKIEKFKSTHCEKSRVNQNMETLL